MRILVTGGAGFIGSNFVRFMLNKYDSYEIVNVDALTYAGNLDNLNDLINHPRFSFIQANITDREEMNALVGDGIDIVVNFAAESHVDRSINEPGIFVHTNVVGTQVLLEAAHKHGIRKYVQVSTDEVYGTLGAEGLFTETNPLMPNSPYSASKASADLLVRAYHETYQLPVNITRCSNNYGPYQFPEKLIPLMIIHALNGKKLPVYGNGMNVRDWLHVEDHCAAIDLVLHQGSNGEIYNIGGNNEATNLQIVKSILRKLGKSEELIEFVADRPGHDLRYAIDATKISSELGWKPRYNFESGLDETIDWYLNNEAWWARIISGEYRNQA